jgi:hypothetical protein
MVYHVVLSQFRILYDYAIDLISPSSFANEDLKRNRYSCFQKSEQSYVYLRVLACAVIMIYDGQDANIYDAF